MHLSKLYTSETGVPVQRGPIEEYGTKAEKLKGAVTLREKLDAVFKRLQTAQRGLS